jgi:16S rRNA (uracil1498-N3)-methyltransferase
MLVVAGAVGASLVASAAPAFAGEPMHLPTQVATELRREIAAARAQGIEAVRIGPRVLRTETAGVAALAALQALWGDWK